jgi:peptidoglycan/LPS O-acetylase OafA/YrhL
MSDAQPAAALSLVKDVSLQLILIAVGAVAIVGSVLASREKTTTWKIGLYWATLLLMASVLFGLLVLGSVVFQMSGSDANPWRQPLRLFYALQLIAVFAGGALFTTYLVKNIR